MPLEIGDCVRILVGPHIGRRAMVLEVSSDRVVVQVSFRVARMTASEGQVVLLPNQVRRLRLKSVPV